MFRTTGFKFTAISVTNPEKVVVEYVRADQSQPAPMSLVHRCFPLLTLRTRDTHSGNGHDARGEYYTVTAEYEPDVPPF